MKKQLANVLSGARILAGVSLYFFNSITSVWFIAIYTFCGLTDLIDGPIARKTHSDSAVGGLLDTVGDVVTYVALAKILLSQKLVPTYILLWFIGDAVGILSSGLIALVRHGRFLLCHALFGKIMGGAIFLLPFASKLVPMIAYLVFFCVIATLAAVESILIQAVNRDGLEDPVTVIGVLKAREQSAEG